MSLLVEPFELLCGLVEFYLRGLGLGDFVFEFFGLARHLDGELLDLQRQLLDLGLVGSAILLEREVVLLLLARRERPLLQLFLVPVHLQLVLVHPLVRLEDRVLNVVQPVLLVRDPLLQLLNFVPQPTGLSLCELFEVLFAFDLLVLVVDELLRVDQFVLHGLEVLIKNFQTLFVLLNVQTQLVHEPRFLPHLRKSPLHLQSG